MGTVYITPSNSRFSSVEIFDDIENEIFNLSKENDCICLLGDFNSRVSTLRDFIDVDDSLSHFCNSADNNSNFDWAVDQIDLEAIEKYGFSIERKSKDNIVNCYGKKLIDICKHCNIIILNGRSMGDQNGEFTCKQSSVVDYCITNTEFLRYVHNVRILPFSSFLSDVHNPIEIVLALERQHSTESIYQQKPTQEIAKQWNPEKVEVYHNYIEDKVDIVKSLENELSNTMLENISLEFIDNIVEKISDVLVESAKNVFGRKPVLTNTSETFNVKYKKPWFTRDCKNARQNYRKAKRLYKKFGGDIFKSDLYEKEKLYKKRLKNANETHRVEMKKKLFSLRTNNPREYWKILNTNTDKKRCNANLYDLFTFYQDCCNKNYNEQEESNNNVFSLDELNMLSDINLNNDINQPITCEEIFKGINMLKNNKACGDDRIFNEYIKSTQDCMLNLYTVLFNKIFDSGVIPTQWVSGNIIPVYKYRTPKL